jgi:glucosylceramidase
MKGRRALKMFMTAAPLVLASTQVPISVAAQEAAAVQNTAPIAITTTSAKKKLAKMEQSASWSTSSNDTAANTITVKPAEKYQTILGFGGAFTGSACFNFDSMSGPQRAKLLDELFSPSGLNLNVCRTTIGASDYSTHAYSYSEGRPDLEMKRFSIDEDRKFILPTIREALKVNPDIMFFSSPWSPPAWMKVGKSMTGGIIQKKYFEAYARYFVHFLKAYAEEGVKIKAVTVQNEVDTDQAGKMPACAWPQEYEADFTTMCLGPALQAAGLDTEIWLIDHNYNLWGRAVATLETPDVRKYAKGIAWHGYLGEPEWMTRVHNAVPDINMYWTEGGPDYTEKRYLTNWSKWASTFTGIMRNWSRSITVWNLALDEHGKPNIGPFSCGGLVQVDSKTKEVTRSGQYYAIAQFSKFVKRGAVRINSTGEVDDIAHVAFENPDGKHILILTNSGDTKTVTVREGSQKALLTLEGDSVSTLVW